MSTQRRRQWLAALRTSTDQHPTVRALVVVALIAVLTLLLAPQTQNRGVELGPDDVDSVADATIVATHDFVFERVDPAGVRTVREAAAAQVLPVWDYDASMEELVERRISAAFAELRESLMAEGRARATVVPEPSSPPQDGSGAEMAEGSGAAANEGSGAAVLEPPVVEPEPAELIALVPADARAQLLAASTRVAELRAGARDSDGVRLDRFAANGFSREVEDALKALVAEAMSKHLVENVSALESVGAGGVTLRTLREGQAVGERRVRQLISFGDIRELDAIIAPARHHLFYIDPELHDAILQTAESLIVVNTRLNESETTARTREASNAAEADFRETLTRQFRQGQTIVDRGEVIDTRTIATLRAMAESAPEEESAWLVILGTVVLIVLLLLPVVLFALDNLRRFTHDTKDLAMMAAVLIAQLLATRVGIFLGSLVGAEGSIPAEALWLLIPFSAGAMIVRILTNAENALVFAVLYALFAGVLFDFDVTFSAIALLGSIVGIVSVRGAQTRTDILRAGVLAGAMILGIALAFGLLQEQAVTTVAAWRALGGFASGVTSALFVYALLPIIEATFRFTTPMRLMELANLNHPALKELILKAPGSYHHSMMVGQLVEAGCEAVGADALLGRVGSYFHDIGKTKTPHYFAENQQGVNPHDKLKPNMSALVIKSHVKDGVELAKQYRLPEEIIDFIKEHHGTSLIQYFYRRAMEQDEGAVNESDYRYPGPKPRTRETAICLLADGIEAASRALPDPSHSHLKGLVQKMINRAFIDGQLDGCDLTLKDLDLIAQAFLLRLTAFYHHRPEYPDARKSQTAKRVKRGEATQEAPQTDGDDGADPPTDDRPSDASGDARATRDDAELNLRRLGM